MNNTESSAESVTPRSDSVPAKLPQPATAPQAQNQPATLARDPLKPSRRRRGKVARLPDRVRQLVNFMLRDGAPYADIIKKLADQGYSLNADNLSRWHVGGFQTWLREESLLDDQHDRVDFAAQLVTAKNGQLIQEASIRLAILRLYSLLLDFDPAVLKDRVGENPGAYARILNALCKLSSGAIELKRLRRQEAESQA